MQKRINYTPYFLFFILLSLIILAFSQTPVGKSVSSIFQNILSPIQSSTHNIFNSLTSLGSSSEIKSLKEQNLVLTQKLIDQSKILQDNKALNDQFQTQSQKSSNLLAADVIGAPGFIPGISVPETLIINRGESDGVKVGDASIYQNNLIGKVIKTSSNLAVIMLITNSESSFTVKTLNTQSQGVANGQGGGALILNNVVLSDTLQKQDTVLTKGDVNENGAGYPPDLVVGKITAISKNPSELFQRAEVRSLLDFAKLSKVFIIVNNQ